MVQQDPRMLLERAEVIHSSQAVAEAINNMASAINLRFKCEQPVILGVMTGAMYLLGQLLPKLTFPMQLGYVQATRYQGKLYGETLDWIVKPPSIIKNRHVLVVDDILDEGVTLKAIVSACIVAGAQSVTTVVLAEKKLDVNKPVKADFIGLLVPNLYVFGCGMDVQGWWRNLPAIYGLSAVDN